MKEVSLLRVAVTEDGIFGVLMDEGIPFCVTVENNDYVFPDGRYICKRVNSPTYGNTFEITGVSGRSHILFHWGNWEDNSLGCVIVAEKFEPIYNKKLGRIKAGIAESKKAFDEFIDRTTNIDEFLFSVNTWKVNG
jgi:hypothetical protein